MVRIIVFILFLISISYRLAAQQPVYTQLHNILGEFDYGSYTFVFNNQTYLARSRSNPYKVFFTNIDLNGSAINDHSLDSNSKCDYPYTAFPIGSKLCLLGRGKPLSGNLQSASLVVLNSDFSLHLDSIYQTFPSMEFVVGKYDAVRHRIITSYLYSIHKDSLDMARWGIMELDTLGRILKNKTIATQSPVEFPDDIIFTSDGNYALSGKMDGLTTYITPFFIKLDTNFNTLWRADLRSTGEKFYTQYTNDKFLELPSGHGYVYLGSMHRNIDTINRYCRYYDYFNTLHFISPLGQITKRYYHNIANKDCELSRPRGIYLKNDSILMVYTETDTSIVGNNTNRSAASSLIIYYNYKQHIVSKQILGEYLLVGKFNISIVDPVCFRTHVGRDRDRGFLTSGWAWTDENKGIAAYIMKTDSCGYTDDHKCKLVYKIGKQVGKSLSLNIVDSLSVLCQPIWTIEGVKYTSPYITHTFSSWGAHKVKLWGFAGKTTDSIEFDVYLDSTNTRTISQILPLLEIYPNPAYNLLNIELVQFSKVYTYAIYNSLGVKIAADSINKSHTLIDISSLTGGIYTIIISNNQGDSDIRRKLAIYR